MTDNLQTINLSLKNKKKTPRHIAHAQSAVVALLPDLLPGLAAHAHSAAIWPLYLYQGMMPIYGTPSSLPCLYQNIG